MNQQVMDALQDLMEMARLDQIDALVYVAIAEDGDDIFGHTDLTEEEANRAHGAVYELVKDLQPTLDS